VKFGRSSGLGSVRCRIGEEDRADFRFFEVERDSEDAARKFDHFISTLRRSDLHAGDAITGFADDADVLRSSWS